MSKDPKTKVGKFIAKVRALIRKEAFNHPEVILRELTNEELTILNKAVTDEINKRYRAMPADLK